MPKNHMAFLTSGEDAAGLVVGALEGAGRRVRVYTDAGSFARDPVDEAPWMLFVDDARLADVRVVRSHPGAAGLLVVAILAEETREAVADALAAGADDCVLATPAALLARLPILEGRCGARRGHLARFEDACSRLRVADHRAIVGTLAIAVSDDLTDAHGQAGLAFDLVESALVRSGAPLDDVDRIRTVVEEGRERLDHARALARALTRATEARGHPRPTVDVNEVLEDALGLVERFVHQRARLVRCYGTIPRVAVARADVEHLVLNLVLNAAQAIRADVSGPHEVRVRTRAAPDRVYIEIQDTGPGIPPATRARMFDLFWSTEDPTESTGLGLWVTRRIVDEHGGSIDVESAPGAGTLVRVGFPAVRSAARHAAAELQPRVLIAEERPSVAQVVAGALHDYQVTVVPGGREAWRALQDDGPWDVVVCAPELEDLSGMQLYARAVRQDPRLASRFVFADAKPDNVVVRQFLERTPCPVLPKPYDLAELRGVVRAVASRP